MSALHCGSSRPLAWSIKNGSLSSRYKTLPMFQQFYDLLVTDSIINTLCSGLILTEGIEIDFIYFEDA